MDTPTAMVMATTYGVALRGRGLGPAGGLLCAAGALLPDLDGVFWDDTMQFLTWHRGPSHSLVGIALLTPVMAWVARRVGSTASFGRLCEAAMLGLVVAVASDLVTWWGTVLLWPFSDARLGIGLIFIIDLWHSAIVSAPFVAWGVQRVRGRALPGAAFRVAAVGSLVWIFGVCGVGHLMARAHGAELAEQRGAELVDVLPQPFSPFRWAHVLVDDRGRTIVFADLIGDREPIEERGFPEVVDAGAVAAVAVTESTAEAELLRWVFRHPRMSAGPEEDGAWEVVYEDLAYQLHLPEWYGPPRFVPFRYRFRVVDGEIVDEGWITR